MVVHLGQRLYFFFVKNKFYVTIFKLSLIKAVTKDNETVNSKNKLKIIIHNLPEDISDDDIKNLEGINVARSSVLRKS